jgi:hypothetical protein
MSEKDSKINCPGPKAEVLKFLEKIAKIGQFQLDNRVAELFKATAILQLVQQYSACHLLALKFKQKNIFL